MKLIKTVSAIMLLAGLVFFTGCEKTEPDVPTADRDKFIGTWNGQSDGSGGHRNFSLVITASSSAPDQILMQNFDGGSGTISATVSGNDFSIPSQSVSGETINGSGSFSNNALSFSFTIDDGQTIENRTGTATGKH